jgi:hypothetical protein
MTEAERRERVIKWLEQIFADVQRLLINDHIFWKLQEVVSANDEFLKASGLFTQWIAEGYSKSALISLRRQAKRQDESISQKGFLAEVAKYPSLVSRAH